MDMVGLKDHGGRGTKGLRIYVLFLRIHRHDCLQFHDPNKDPRQNPRQLDATYGCLWMDMVGRERTWTARNISGKNEDEKEY